MATQHPTTTSPTDDKNQITHIEANNGDEVFEKSANAEKVDEFGAHTKTDPREIALVKKLDWYMLVGIPRRHAFLSIC